MALDPFEPHEVKIDKLPGSWNTRRGNRHLTVTFEATGQYQGAILNNGKVEETFEGNWTIKTPYIGNIELVWKFTKSTSIPAGTVDRDEIVMLNEDVLVLWTKNRERRAYQRVKPKK